MAQAAHVFLKTSHGVTGPVSFYHLQELVRRGMVGASTLVSPDGVRWLSAGRIRGLLPDGAKPAAREDGRTPAAVPGLGEELKRIAHRVDRAADRVARCFPWVVALAAATALAVGEGLVYLFLAACASKTADWVLLVGALPPALLLAAAAGQAAGNLALRLLCGLNNSERRYLALHVPWARAPRRWGWFLCNWLYNGDWLLGAGSDLNAVYARLFFTGPAPAGLGQELALWDQVFAGASGFAGGGGEAGRSVWELARVERLPTWTRELEPGTNYERLVRHLGRVGRDWASCLLQRARLRMPALAPEYAEPEDALFEFHYLEIGGGREALLVIIRSHTPSQRPRAARRISALKAAA